MACGSKSKGKTAQSDSVFQREFSAERSSPSNRSGHRTLVLWGLELGEENTSDPARPSLILRRAGEADLWEIAKNTGSTVEAIRKANALEAEPRQDQMLLIPVM